MTLLEEHGDYNDQRWFIDKHYDNGYALSSLPLLLNSPFQDLSGSTMTGGLRLTKTDSLTGSPIEGVKFNIFQGDTLVATMTTDENDTRLRENGHFLSFSFYIHVAEEV